MQHSGSPLFLWCVPGRLFVAGNTCLFVFFLLSLSLPLSFFLSFSLSFLPPWVSLDAFVIAGNLLLSSFGVSLDACVVAGNTFLSFLSFFSSLPTPPSWTLAPFSPFPSLFLSLLPGVFLNATLRITSLSLVCPWTLVRSWEHLPFSFFLSSPFLSLSLSFFLSFLLSLLPPSLGVPGCFCHSWEPSPLFLWCVLGRMRRSREHLPFFSLPTPPSCRHLSLGCY